MKPMQTRHHPASRAGMTLLEVMLALVVFSIAAVALVQSINQVGETMLLTRTLRSVDIGLASHIDEYSKAPLIQELDKEIKAGEDGISYRIRIEPVQNLKTKQNQPIVGIFRVLVTAKWKESNQPMTKDAETLRYAGMYNNQ
jgi:prepilin-type N-terminal cleavage/methylation domain-containing protein